MIVGQVNYVATWAACVWERAGGGKVVAVEIDVDAARCESSQEMLRLRCEVGTVPQTVGMRLPEGVMPLQTQLIATEEQKKEGFLSYYKGCKDEYVGYCTKKGAPVYLIKKTAFPLRKSWSGVVQAGVNGGKFSSWKTYHFLPEPLVPEDTGSTVSIVPYVIYNARASISILYSLDILTCDLLFQTYHRIATHHRPVLTSPSMNRSSTAYSAHIY